MQEGEARRYAAREECEGERTDRSDARTARRVGRSDAEDKRIQAEHAAPKGQKDRGD